MRRLAVFKSNSREELVFIEAMKRGHIAFPAGHPIVHEGASDSPLYTLFSGWAFRFKTLSDGRRQILNFLLPGDLIGFQGHMLEDSPHGVEALTEVELCVFARTKIWELYRTFPELAFDVTWLTAHEEGLVDENLLSVGRRSALESIAMLLIHLHRRAKALGVVTEEGLLHLPITQQHIADALGLSLVHTNKTLRRLQKLGLFRFEQRRLAMTDPKAIEKLADYWDSPVKARPLI